MSAFLTNFRGHRLGNRVISRHFTQSSQNWLVGFVVASVAFDLGLFLFGDTALRMPMRIGMYAISLAYMVLVRGRGLKSTPVNYWNIIGLILAIGLLNPDRGGWIAGLAQIMLYLAVLSPLVWGERFRVDRSLFERVIVILWAYYAASALVGALQVEFPGRFDGATSINYEDHDILAVQIQTADGTRMMRPKGLTDVAGGAGNSGVYAIILSVGLLLTARSRWWRVAVIMTMVVSLFGIFLSHGRTNLIVTGVSVSVMLLMLLRRRDYSRSILLATVVVGVVVLGTMTALSVGGANTLDRWATLVDDDPSSVLYKNRGFFLDTMLREDIWKYPFGAGSGRWGMMNSYFAAPSTGIWAEMMWQALLYDGGIPLIIIYAVLLAFLMRRCWRLAMTTQDPRGGLWAIVIFGFTASTVAASFVYPVYIKPAGLQVFLLNACLNSYQQVQLAMQRVDGATHVPLREVRA